MILWIMMMSLVLLFILQLLLPTQVRCQTLGMMANSFDDQYKGCEDNMEIIIPDVLQREKSYQQFAEMWENAKAAWIIKRPSINSTLPAGFKDEYGTAIVLYTMESPYPIYQELNQNVTIAGQSLQYYFNNFHFKAFHFYLTRALQELGRGCKNTFRGTRLSLSVSDPLRFGQFTSVSLTRKVAERFGTETFFEVTTCFGVDIQDLSDYEEQEVLIPVTEKFKKVKERGKNYTLKSTGERCSYFNCALLGAPGGTISWTLIMSITGLTATLNAGVLKPSQIT
ncbi:ecto-ADP-ribosyltransferase 5 [Pelodytes ibericus]